MIVCDWDDFHDGNHQLDRFYELKRLNPRFRATLFAVPGLCSDEFLATIPRWLELAVHGWLHPDPYEASEWTYERTIEVMEAEIVRTHFVNGFKAPGWQISDGTYQALLEHGWWVADQTYNDHRRPSKLRFHTEGQGGDARRNKGVGDHWHGHIQNVCDNGIEETWGCLTDRVRGEEEFRFVSEAAR